MPYLSAIYIYPVKSFDPISLPASRIVPGGGLEHDRELALFDESGNYVNGKRNACVHRLRMIFDAAERCVAVHVPDEGRSASFEFPNQKPELEKWLSDFFAMPVSVQRQPNGGFPDDKNATGPTIIGSSTLETVASWYPGLLVNEVRRRFRTNLEISDTPAFWEDRLYDKPDEAVRFRIGDVLFEGTNPCQRCIVPTRQTTTGEQYPDFSNIFMTKRQQTLPDWANSSRFNHYYRLAVNTRVPASEVGKVLRVGDPVKLE